MSVSTPTRDTTATSYVPPAIHRPGWVTFAAVVSFVLGAFYILLALTEFSNSYWLYNYHAANVYNVAGQHMLWWGIMDSILAVTAIAAGFSLLRGGFFGLFVAMTGAGLSALRWFFYITADPWLAITIIAVDMLIIYGLASSGDYFDAMQES